MTGTPLAPNENSALPMVPGAIIPVPPDFSVSINANFAGLSFDTAIELQKVLIETLKSVGVSVFTPGYIRMEFHRRY